MRVHIELLDDFPFYEIYPLKDGETWYDGLEWDIPEELYERYKKSKSDWDVSRELYLNATREYNAAESEIEKIYGAERNPLLVPRINQ